MAVNLYRGEPDPVLDVLMDVLRRYQADHPDARIDLYRSNPVSIRIRVIDPDFAGQSRVDRSNQVWSYFDQVDEETQQDISSLVTITPEEMESSPSSLLFEEADPSFR